MQRKRHSPEVVAERERRMEGRRWRTRVLEVVVRQRSLTVASCASTPLMVTSHITKSSDFAFQHPSGTFIHQKSKQSPKEPRAGPHSQERSKPGKYAENTKHTEYMQGIDIVLEDRRGDTILDASHTNAINRVKRAPPAPCYGIFITGTLVVRDKRQQRFIKRRTTRRNVVDLRLAFIASTAPAMPSGTNPEVCKQKHAWRKTKSTLQRGASFYQGYLRRSIPKRICSPHKSIDTHSTYTRDYRRP